MPHTFPAVMVGRIWVASSCFAHNLMGIFGGLALRLVQVKVDKIWASIKWRSAPDATTRLDLPRMSESWGMVYHDGEIQYEDIELGFLQWWSVGARTGV